MTEHVHEYGIDMGRCGYYCKVEGCNETLLLEEALPRLNDYEILFWNYPALVYMVERSRIAYADTLEML